MKKIKMFLMGTLLMIPTMVLASSGNNIFSIGSALGIEAFVSIHMSIFVLIPLSRLISQDNSKKVFWILFILRAAILLFFDFFITTYIAMIDFFAVFIGAFLVVPILSLIKKQNPFQGKNTINNNLVTPSIINYETTLKCLKCGETLKEDDKFCPNCGADIASNTVISNKPKEIVNYSNFDSIYANSEDQLLEIFIKKELTKLGIENNNLIPRDVLKRKNILNIIFSILLFVFISLIFFHFPIYTYIIGLIILFIFFKLTRKYDFLKYLKKEIKSRPNEKISNIIMNVKNSLVADHKIIRVVFILIAIILPLIIFVNPRIMYEKVHDGYAVRFYAFGLTNFKTVTIPETYKGEKVVSLRGNTFSNMSFLEKVELPNSIIEIRGQAFKNDKKLVEVNIPSNLEYLGGGAFYNCKSIINITLPNTLNYMGGEVFYGASSLEYIKLSKNLSEIRGNSFENCISLKSIIIPDKVIRIGGHAFYGDESLSEVIISKNSKLEEIGSSAFRKCYSLNEITIPKDTIVNERSFKESPTSVYRYGENYNNIYDNSYFNSNYYYSN